MASFAARDYFSLFGLPVRFAIDLVALDAHGAPFRAPFIPIVSRGRAIPSAY